MIGCVLISILLNWLMNNLVLENYYKNRKVDSLKDTFTQIDTIFSSTSQSDDIRLEMEKLGGKNNYSVMVVDRKFQVVDFNLGTYEMCIRDRQYGDEVFRLAAERGKPFILGNRSGGAGTPDRIAPAKCIPGGFIGNPAFGQCSAALKTLNLLRGLVVIRSISFHRLKIDKAAA